MTNARTAKTTREKAAAMRVEAERAQARRRTLLVSAAIAAVIVVLVAVVVLVKMASNDQKQTQLAASAPPANLVDGGILVGSSTAKVTIQLYEDFQCPVCKAFEAENATQLKAWVGAGTVKLIYRPVAILDTSQNAQYSTRSGNAAAALVATDPAAFQAFHDLLYANQPAEGGVGLPDSQLLAYAVQAGGQKAAIEPAITGQKYAGWVTSATDDFSKKYQPATPTVVVNGAQIGAGSVPTPAALKAAVDAAAK